MKTNLRALRPSIRPGVLLVLAWVLAAAAAAQTPANDNFASAIEITGTTAQVTGTNVGATMETGEPGSVQGWTAGQSVWWKWTAPFTGVTGVSTSGSQHASSGSLMLAVYVGDAVGALSVVAQDAGQNGRVTAVGFPVTAGVTYRIAAYGYNSVVGTLALTLGPAITVSPKSQGVFAGASHVFSVTAASATTPTYQWRKNGTDLPGATSATLSLTNLQIADAGRYDVVVTANAAAVASLPARLTVQAVAGGAAKIAAGESHSVIVKRDGTLLAAGSNGAGQLGDATTTNRNAYVTMASGVTQVAAGDAFTVFLKSDGSAWAVGDNYYGQLGDAATSGTSRNTAVQVATDVVQLAAGRAFTLLLKTDGSVWATGRNLSGQFGDGSSVDRNVPGKVINSGVAQIAAGGNSSYFITTGGALQVTGRNDYGQLGDGTIEFKYAPVAVVANVTKVAAGRQHAIFLKADGSAWTMGFNGDGEVGNAGVGSYVPTPFQAATAAASIGAGVWNSYFFAADGSVSATGWNAHGQLGDPATANRLIPTKLTDSFTAIATGYYHSIAMAADGSVWAAGDNSAGQLGDGTNTARQTWGQVLPGLAVAPSFTVQPQAASVLAGQSVTLTAAATGTAPWTYQWRKGGATIQGATDASYTIAAAAAADAASYTVVATNAAGSTPSNAATLTVNVAPAFTTQPQSQIAAVGSTVTLSVAASGTPTPTLQWKKNNIVRAGATSATLTLANVQLADAGNYHAVASNSVSDTASDVAALTVIPANWLIVDSTYNGLTPGGSGNYASNQNTGLNSQGNRLANSFTTGAAAVDLQSVTLALYTHMGLTDVWSLRVCADASGSPGTVLATLANPAGAPAWTEGNFAFAATTPLPLTASTTYWLVLEPAYAGTDGMLLWKSGGSRQGITISDRASDRASWAAWRSIGNQASNAFVVYGTPVATVAPAITTQPVSQTVTVGANVTFSVVATGTPAPAFQWKKDGTDIPNATSSTLTLNNVQAGAAGSYTVVVSNGTLPNATSSAATLTVNAAPVAPVVTSSATATAVANVAFTYAIAATPGPLTGYGLTGTLPSGLTFSNATGVISGTTAAVGTYPVTLTATNAAGTSANFAFTLTVSAATDAPIVTTQPQTQSVLPGATVTFTVAVSGLTPLSYQWTKNYSALPNGATASGAVISGARTATLTLTGVQASDVGNYQVVVSNPVGSTQSNLVTLTVGTTGVAPMLTSPMRHRTAVVGQNVLFSVTAAGSPTLTYQWKKDGNPIDGATNADYLINNVQPADAASYLVRVTNTYGYAEPQPMKLTIASAAPANDSFANAASLTGSTASATGSNIGASFETGEPDHSGFGESGHNHGGYSVWWQWTAPGAGVYEFTVTPGGTGFEPLMSVYTGSSVDALTRIGAAQLNKVAFYAVSGTTYRIALDGYFGATGNFSLAVAAGTAVPLQITVQPMNQGVAPGTNALFHLFTQGTGPISYQWKKGTTALVNGANISGATSNMLMVASAQPADAGTYTCVVSNPVDTITSSAVTLTVADPVIGYPPQSQTVAAGATVNFYVSASGTAPLTYQWKKGAAALANGGNIAGATTSNLTLTNVQAADAGDYTVVVTNGASASATSPVATLTVTAGAAAPVNDNFASAQVVTGTIGTTTGTNVGATGETGEPAHYNSSGAASSVWYKWTAPQSGTVVFDTIGSNFDTVMAAYSGSTLAALTQLAQDDEGGGSGASKVSFSATAGVVYCIAVGSWSTTRGNITLNWVMAANDNFAAAQVVAGTSGTTTGTNVGATAETGEPNHYGSSGASSSVWYKWTAPLNGSVVFDTIGSSFDTVMAAYTGTAVGSLTMLAQDDDGSGSGNTSKIAFNVASGTVYSIAVAGFGTARGSITLNWLASTTPIGGGTPPVITSAGTATAIVGTAFSFQVAASNSPTSFAVTGALPAGVTFNTTTGLLSGTPTAAGSFPVSVTATNGSGTSPAATLTITVIPSIMLVEDGFTGSAGAAPDASKFEWSGEVTQTGSGTLNLLTQSVQSSWLRSKAGAAVGAGETLVLQLRAYAYAEGTSPGIVYGDKQPRGLRVAGDPNNAVEFYSASRTSLGLRVRKDGVESLATYALPAGVDTMHDYEITVTTAAVVFKVDGVVAGTFTTNIPTGVLNVYVSSDDGGGVGNVPVTIDSLSLTLLGRTAAAGPIGHWAGEGNTSDATGRNPAGVIHGGVTYGAGRVGQAFAFGGTDGWIDLGSQTGDFGTADFTVALWVRLNSLSGEQVLIEDYVETESAARAGWGINLKDGAFFFGFDGGRQLTSATIAAQTWYHVAVTRSGSAFTLYVNGVSQATGSFTPTLSSTAALKLGHRGAPADTTGSVDTRGFFLNGALDDVRIYNYPLNSTEILGLAATGAAIATSSAFAADAEGWNVVSFGSLATDNYAVVGNYPPTFVATGGNPGGYLSMNDPDGGDFTFSAPAAFLGNRLGSLGATLTYELIHPVGTLNYPAVDVILTGNGVRLVWQGSPAIAPSASAWTPVTVPLSPSAQWHVGTTGGALATVADFQNVLGNLTGLFIRGEYTDGPDTTGLDNVVLGVSSGVAPVITTPPQSQTVAVGGNVTFAVVATGSPLPIFQWKKNNSPLADGTAAGLATVSGAQSATLTLTGVQTGDAGSYTVVVTNGVAPDATSAAAVLTVNVPVNGWAASFDALTAGVTLDGQGSPAWTSIKNANYVDPLVQAGDAAHATNYIQGPVDWRGSGAGLTFTPALVYPMGNYRAEMLMQFAVPAPTSAHGNVVSLVNFSDGAQAVQFGARGFATGTTPPAGFAAGAVVLCLDDTLGALHAGATLSANTWYEVKLVVDTSVASGRGSLSYRNLTAGETAFTTDPALQNVDLKLTATGGQLTFNRATLLVFNGGKIDAIAAGPAAPPASVAPTITTQPVSTSVATGATATFTVAATGTPAPAFRWQGSFDGGLTWSDLPDGAPFGGVTTATLTVSGASASFSRAQFRCIVSNSAGPVTSNVVSLRVAPAAFGFSGSDDFAATTANWSVPVVFSGNGRLPLANSRLEYTVAAGTANDGALREWTANVGAYTRDWSVQVDVHLASLTLPSGQFANLNLMVVRADDALKPFNQMNWMGVAIDRYGTGSATVHNFEGSQLGNGNRSPATGVIEVLNNSTDATLRISFNATTKELTSWYDADGATNGFAWTQLQSINIGSGTYTWGMTDSSTFAVVLAGGSSGVALTSGQAWFDNFLASEATGAAPVITTQPAAQTVVIGGTAMFNVVATGTAPLTYQWKLGPMVLANTAAISGATSATLTITGVQPADAGLYTCVVSSGASSTTSNGAQLSVASSAQPPVITSLPRQQTALVGGTATFAVTVAGTPPFTYQWKKNTENIPNATSATLTLTNVQLSDAATYTVQITGTTTITSSPFVLTVAATAPANDQFANALVLSGATTSATGSNIGATFEPVEPDHAGHAEGENHGGYSVWWQWTAPATGVVAVNTIGSTFDTLLAVYTGSAVNALALVGADDQGGGNGTSALTFQATAGTVYRIAVDGFFGATGAVALNLAPGTAAAPAFTFHPSSITIPAGSSPTLGAGVTGTYPIAFQWKKGGANLPGATGRILPLTNIQGADAGDYSLVATNAVGTATSNSATVTVTGTAAPTIVTQPAGITVAAGQNATFSVVAVGTPAPTYQWRKGGGNLNGATAASYTITGAQAGDAGSYDVVVTNSVSSVTSTAAPLTVTAAGTGPTIIAHPQSQAVALGAPLALGVGVSGPGPFTYQWKKEGSSLDGATNATFAIAAVTAGDAGSYTVAVTSAGGTTVSNAATVTVVAAGFSAAQAAAGGGYRAGGTVTLVNRLAYAGTVAELRWEVLLPAGWSFVSTTSGDERPAGGATSLLSWRWTTVPANGHAFTYTLNVPAGAAGAQPIVALLQFRQNGAIYQVLAKPDPLLVPRLDFHSADLMGAAPGTARDNRINLAELLRVIELYNHRAGTVRTGQYTMHAASEDGYTPGPGGAGIAVYHSADMEGGQAATPPDGRINLSELLRVIELYNYRAGTVRTGQYHPQAGTVDGFAPGP